MTIVSTKIMRYCLYEGKIITSVLLALTLITYNHLLKLNVSVQRREKRWILICQKHFRIMNRGMRGVDQMDQSISLYRVTMKGSEKWWWVIFTYLVDIAVSNAWRLHVVTKKKNKAECMDHLVFKRSIVRAYLRHSIPSKNRQTSSIIVEVDRNDNGYTPERITNPLRCVICHNRVRWRCQKCSSNLCRETLSRIISH